MVWPVCLNVMVWPVCLKVMVFGDVIPYELVNEYQLVGETCDCIFSLEDVCYPKYSDSTFHRNVGAYLPNCRTSPPGLLLSNNL
jgi:hypothetical protein